MKFRGLISDNIAMRDFGMFSASIAKLSKECVIRIAQKAVYFIVPGDEVGQRKPFVWCELPVSFYFREYLLEGVSPQYNEIYLSFDSAMLAKSSSTLTKNAKALKIKLTHKQTACLTFDIEQIGGSNTLSRQCVHDIPVEVINRQYWSDFQEPNYNDFHVSMDMPSLKSIKNIVERMKNINSSLTISATKFGRLTLRCKTNMVTLSAHFPDLNVQSYAVASTIVDGDKDETIDRIDDNQTVSVVIDAKRFLMFLSAMQFNNSRTVCSIVNSRMLKLHVDQPGALSFQCFFTETSQ